MRMRKPGNPDTVQWHDTQVVLSWIYVKTDIDSSLALRQGGSGVVEALSNRHALG